MAKDAADVLGTALGRVARETAKSVSANVRKGSDSPVGGPKGVATGVGLAALAPLAVKGAGRLVRGVSSDGVGPVQKVGQKVGRKVTGTLKDAAGEAGGAAVGSAKEAGKGLLPGVGSKSGKGGKSEGLPGVGKGRRMPVQQDLDIGAPLSTVYNQWTQFEDWPKFMHRLQSVSQEDDTHVAFKAKIWGISKEFKAEIVEQLPDERIKWRVTEGLTHQGVVTFHELAPRLTRVEVNLDVEPGSLIEKAARGMRHVKRAVRADMARFKAYVLMEGEESGAWRGAVEGGDVKRSRGESSSRGRSGSTSRGRSGSQGQSRSSSRGRSGSSSKSQSGSSSRGSGSGSSRSSRSSSGGRKSSTSGGSNGRSSSSRTQASSSNGRSRSSSRKRSTSGSRS
ncbi:MAG TPA: SRPBCC family protein [Thermoleophilaceae bacterium]|nr:SRPBCC family protein [Thermoleophilaceae bacterium]